MSVDRKAKPSPRSNFKLNLEPINSIQKKLDFNSPKTSDGFSLFTTTFTEKFDKLKPSLSKTSTTLHTPKLRSISSLKSPPSPVKTTRVTPNINFNIDDKIDFLPSPKTESSFFNSKSLSLTLNKEGLVTKTKSPFKSSYDILYHKYNYPIIKIDRSKDYTKEEYMVIIKEKFKEIYSKIQNQKTTVIMNSFRKFISIKTGEKILDSLFNELNFIAEQKQKLMNSTLTPRRPLIEVKVPDQHLLIKDFDSLLSEVLIQIDECIQNRKHKKKLDLSLEKLAKISRDTKVPQLYISILYLIGKATFLQRDFVRAIRIYLMHKHQCDITNLIENKIHSYKGLGKCYQTLRNYKVALSCFVRFLQIAWNNNSRKHELLAYENIGYQFFYLGEVEKANYFHERSGNGVLEPNNSGMKLIAKAKIKPRTLTSKVFEFSAFDQKLTKHHLVDEEELSLIDDFEIPLPLNKVYQMNNEANTKTLNDKIMSGQIKAEWAHQMRIRLKKKQTVNPQGKIYIEVTSAETLVNADNTISYENLVKKSPNKMSLVHLSVNRNPDNFLILPIVNNQVFDNEDLTEILDPVAADRIKATLEKFKISILAVKRALTVCSTEQSNFLNSNIKSNIPKLFYID